MPKKTFRNSTSNIPRDPPDSIKRILRQEVHYACPVPGCGKPFLEWHHFDPSWEERHHHDPAGMIALCTVCHPMADRGKWTRDDLHSYKQNSPTQELIRSEFGWSELAVVYRLGGNYAIDCGAGVIAINNRRVLWDGRSPEGRLLFSLDFRGEKGQSLLQVRQNFLSVQTTRVSDFSLNTGATYLKLWLGNRKPGIELQFHRLTIDKLRDKIMQDSERSSDAAEKLFPKDLFPVIHSPPAGFLDRLIQIPIDHITQHCLDSDGTVTLIDITRARLYTLNGGLVDVSESGVRLPNGSRWSGCHAIEAGGYAFNITVP
jgi:hypothetical protein